MTGWRKLAKHSARCNENLESLIKYRTTIEKCMGCCWEPRGDLMNHRHSCCVGGEATRRTA